MVLGLRQDTAQPRLDLVELGLAHDQRRCELDHRVPAIVGAAVQARVEEGLGQEATQQPLGLCLVEGLARRLVLDQLDPVEEPGPADVADDRQVQQLLQRRLEGAPRCQDVGVQALALEDVEVGQGDGGGDRMPAEGVAVREVRRPVLNGSTRRSLAIIAPMGE